MNKEKYIYEMKDRVLNELNEIYGKHFKFHVELTKIYQHVYSIVIYYNDNETFNAFTRRYYTYFKVEEDIHNIMYLFDQHLSRRG